MVGATIMEHRTTKVATEAFLLVLEGAEFTTKGLENRLSGKMENPPSKQTIAKVLRQMREDDILKYSETSKRHRATITLDEYRHGHWVDKRDVRVDKIRSEIKSNIDRQIERGVKKALGDENSYYDQPNCESDIIDD